MDSNKTNKYQTDSRETRAERVRVLREPTRLSRRAFALKYEISPGNLQNWETPRYGGLTEDGAKILVDAFRDEHIVTTTPWLLYGLGQAPILPSSMHLVSHTATMATANMNEELALLQQHHPEVNILHIADDVMAPFYRTGDIVAGNPFPANNFNHGLHQICIISLPDNSQLTRLLLPCDHEDMFDLAIDHRNIVSKNVSPLSVAPIFWWRRPQS